MSRVSASFISDETSQPVSAELPASAPVAGSRSVRSERHKFNTRPRRAAPKLEPTMSSTIEFTDTHARIEVDNLDTPCSPNVTACRQCLNALMSRPPKAFRAQINYNSHPGVVKVIVEISFPLLSQIPLLADICESTVGTPRANKKTSFHAPCPAWGLLSLLLLMENSVKMQHWLGGAESAPSLAGLTLQMADFLQVTEQRERITDWLRSLLHSLCGLNHKMLVEEEPEGGRAAPDARELVQMLHDTQVLSALPEPLCPGVYTHFHNEFVLASAAYYAVELPPALLCTWVRCNAPSINLTGAKLTVQEWIKLLHSVSHVAEVVELHVDAPEDTAQAAAHATTAQDAAAATGLRGLVQAVAQQPEPVADTTSLSMQQTARFSAAEPVPLTELTGLQWMLTALDSACMHLKHLRVLDFNRLPIHAHHLHLLGRVFHSMSDSLEELRVWDFEDWEKDVPEAVRNSYTPETKALFFRTVSMLQNLRNLWLPVWKGFVGSDSDAALDLLGLKSLEVVWVSETDYSVVVAYDLQFQVIEKEPYAKSPAYSMSPK